MPFPTNTQGAYLERGQEEGDRQGSLPPSRVPQTLAQRPWLWASMRGGGAGVPGHSMTFRGPQRRAPGQSLPRTSRSGRGFKVSVPFSIEAETED